ncbi:MAG: hypothetical protein ACQEWV_21850 [Bacillota bacterium]
MPLEQEVIGLLIGGFSIVMGIAILITLLLWLKNKNNSAPYVLHLLFFSVAIYFSLMAISFDYNHTMASEEISLQIGISGVVWALSMLCLLIGIVKFSRTKKYSGSS